MGRLLPFFFSLVALIVAIVWVAATLDLHPEAAAMAGLSWQTGATVFALFILASSLASARLWFIARDIRSPISPHDAVVALTVGSLAGALFFQVMGQTIARSTLLAHRGTPVAATLVMTGYERVMALLVSLLFGMLGAWYLFGSVSFDVHNGGGELLKLVVVGCLAVLAGSYIAWGQPLADWLRPAFSTAHVGSAARSLLISIAIQLCTLAAYLVTAHAVAPNLHLVEVAAASAVVMLVTALPISFAGWGIREFSAVLALGAIGMPPESALVVAVLVGIMSMAALMLLSAASLVGSKVGQDSKRQQRASFTRPNFDMMLAWSLPLGVATLVFFQVYIPTAQGTKLNVNLADPLAVVSAALFLLSAVRLKSWPDWRVSELNQNMIIATAAMVAALAIGWLSFGWTAWAFASKFLGWFVLLAYGLTGALIISKAGEASREVLFMTFIAAGAAVGAVEIALVLLEDFGFTSLPTPRATGVAANPNAFALQMALVACVALVAVRSERLATLAAAIALSAIWLSASRAGIGAGILILGATAVLMPSRRAILARAVLTAGALMLLQQVIYFLPSLDTSMVTLNRAENNLTPLQAMANSPSQERLQTLVGGLSLFAAHPFFGAGLGAFAESWRQQHGEVQVIHSTPIWLLAEFGLIGAAAIILPFARITVLSLANATEARPTAVLAFLACLAFGAMASVHEMLYQRPLWFLLGTTLTLGLRTSQSTRD